MRLLDRFPVLCLDMNGTFMFGEDRFDNGEDFHRTYSSVGGSKLSASEVTHFIRDCYDGMSRDYSDPARYDDFPSLREGFRRMRALLRASYRYSSAYSLFTSWVQCQNLALL